DARALRGGDRPDRGDAGAVPREIARDRAAGRARHGGGVPARPQDNGHASRRRHRRRHAVGRQGRRPRAGGLSGGHRLMLSIQGLNTHYGASHILQGVDLELPRGRIAAVLGRNGVGKTTTVKTIMGLVQPSAGLVALEGSSITAWAPHRVARAGVAYVPEGRLIFPDLTVVENIRIAERTPAKAWPLARLLELFPSLSERQRHRGSQLSGGEQQML